MRHSPRHDLVYGPLTSNTKAILHAGLLGQKNDKYAKPLLLEGYEAMKERKKKIPPAGWPRLAEAAQQLVQFYEAQGNAAKAERWPKELAARRAGKKQPKK